MHAAASAPQSVISASSVVLPRFLSSDLRNICVSNFFKIFENFAPQFPEKEVRLT